MVFFVPMGGLDQETRQTLQWLQTTQALVSARIQIDPTIMGGLPVIRGTWIPVATIVKQARAGLPPAMIAKSLPPLEERHP